MGGPLDTLDFGSNVFPGEIRIQIVREFASRVEERNTFAAYTVSRGEKLPLSIAKFVP